MTPVPVEPHQMLRLALPKGRMQEGVFRLLGDAGLHLRMGDRGYRPTLPIAGFDIKVLKPQNIIEMLHIGSRDLGFAGADWVAELGADVVELLDTALDPVRLVAAAPKESLVEGRLPARRLVVASEYERLTLAWIEEKGLDAVCVRSYGATEVFPPEDADCIVDNTATGSTLRENGLQIVDELVASSTRLYASRRALEERARRAAIDRFAMLIRSVLLARQRVMVEVNVTPDRLEDVVTALPCMREPTIAQLHGQTGFAVKAAVLRRELPAVIPEIKARGGTDIVVSSLNQIVP